MSFESSFSFDISQKAMASSNFANGVSAEEGNQPVTIPQVDYDSKSGESKLIVTFFAKDRPPRDILVSDPTGLGGQRLDAAKFENHFTNLLTNLVAPEPLSLISSLALSRSVFHQAYTASPSFPSPSQLRHDPFISGFETANALELVFDLVPSCPPKPFRPIKLAVFDMDSTLIEEEVIDELARSIDITDEVSLITARAMNGEIDFEQSLRERLALLKGVRADVWDDLKKKSIHIARGARKLCGVLRERGVILAVVSGGFVPMAEWLKEQLGLDYAYANHVRRTRVAWLLSLILKLYLQIPVSPPTSAHPYPHLSGKPSPDHPIITPERKRHILLSLAAEHSIPLSETLAVGDGSNDLLMLAQAGLGVAFKAKPKVQKRAPQRLNGDSLADLLFLLGEPDIKTARTAPAQ